MTFEDVVKQLQMNNRSEAGRDSRHTKMLGDLKTAIEGVTTQVAESEESPSSKKEGKKTESGRAKKLLGAIGGLGKSFQTAFSNLGAVKTGIPGLTLGLLAKLAVIPLLIKFLQSELWDEIKTFLLNPSVPKLKELFSEYNTELTIFAGIIGAWAIVKLTTTATAIATAIGGIGTALTALGAVFGVTGAVAAGTILAVLAVVIAAGKGILDGIKGFKKNFEETGSVVSAISEGLKEFTSGFLAFFPDLIKNALGSLIGLVNEDLGNKIKAFSFKKYINDFIDGLTKNFEDLFASIGTIFGADATFKERVDAFFSGLDAITDIIFASINIAYDAIRGAFSLAGFELPDVKIQDLLKDTYRSVIEFFKGITSISTEDILNSIPGATETLKLLGVLERTTDEKIKRLDAEIEEQRKMLAMGDKRTALGFSREKILAQAQQELTGLQQIKLLEQQGMPAMQSGGLLSSGRFALVGEQGPELIMSKAPMQVFSEQRTDQLGMAALNKLTSGGDMGGGGGSMFINQGNNIQNVSRNVSPTFIVNQDNVMTTISRSLAM